MKDFSSTTPESEKDLAQTPEWFVRSLSGFTGIRFKLDACANESTSKCARYYSISERCEDGLALPWIDGTWCNPPFSNITPWIRKAASEADLGVRSAIIFPDNTETEYSRVAFELADSIIRMPFRLKFLRPDGSEFLDRKGKKQGPQFPCCVALFTKIGLVMPTRTAYYDFRFYE